MANFTDTQYRISGLAILTVFLAVLVVGVVAFWLGQGSNSVTDTSLTVAQAKLNDSDLPLLFIVNGKASVEGNTITIGTNTVEWFTERPERKAGVTSAKTLAENWELYGFVSDPPNAALSGSNLDVIVELTDPKSTASSVSFAFRVLRGEIPGEINAASLFIDSSSSRCNLKYERFKDDLNVAITQNSDSDFALKVSCTDMKEITSVALDQTKIGQSFSVTVQAREQYPDSPWVCEGKLTNTGGGLITGGALRTVKTGKHNQGYTFADPIICTPDNPKQEDGTLLPQFEISTPVTVVDLQLED